MAGTAAVLASMVLLFTVPPQLFVWATFLSTSCMMGASYYIGARWGKRPTARGTALGVASAAALYLVFYAGNAAVSALHPFGIGSSDARSIYTLIASPSNPLYLQAAVLLFDAAGYESFFRGTLQSRLRPRLGAASAPAVAAFDAAVHLMTLNPLWVVTTFIADTAWGLTYHRSREVASSFTSHLVWDLVVFLILPLA